MSSESGIDLKERVARVLTETVAPLLQMDGGSVELVGIDGGVVQVRLPAICTGCPGTVYAVVMSIEEELRRQVPEVDYLEVVP